jgi:small-conductance mechanosensitive channel
MIYTLTRDTEWRFPDVSAVSDIITEAGLVRRIIAKSIFRHILACLVIVVSTGLFLQADTPGGQDVLGFLSQAVSWYRQFPVQQQLANDASDAMFLSDNRQLSDQAIRLSFEFARAQADLLSKQVVAQPSNTQADGTSSRYQRLQASSLKYEQQAKKSQEEVESMRIKLQSSTGKRREALLSAIAEAESELQLLTARRDALRNMMEFLSEAGGNGGAGSLQSQIEELARAIPAAAAPVAKNQSQTASSSSTPVAVASLHTQPSGILGLITDLISLSRKARALDEAISATDALTQSAKTLRAPLRANLRVLARRGDELANEPDSMNPAELKQQKAQMDALTAQFKDASEAVLPMSKLQIVLVQYRRNLTGWQNATRTQYSSELKSLVVRLVMLAIALAFVFGTSELWRKALLRYVHEPRRRHQLLLVRRFVLWFVIAIVVAFAFSTELGSLATFAGLLTAGIAVALQNVILSVAAYFFLIGKYGIRVGDRVQISGITGEVIDIGLVRLHLMELSAGGADAQPTGRVVVFSNSVVFQPTGGFFKQIPGTNFVWHEITLTLAPDSDYCAVEERLVGAINAVFSDYRDQMERQRRHLEKTLGSVSVNSLAPQSRLRLTQSGLQVVFRYPVGLENAADIDDRVARGLLDAIEREPQLKLVGTGVPNIQPIAGEMVKNNV